MKLTSMVLIISAGAALSACDSKQSITQQQADEGYTAQPSIVESAPVEYEPHKPISKQLTVEFEEGSDDLSDTAKSELSSLTTQLDENKEQYLTIRFLDKDGLDTTAPTAEFKMLVDERKNAVTKYLEEQGAEFAKVVVDVNGEVSNEGENNPMAHPDSADSKDSAEFVVVTIEVDGELL